MHRPALVKPALEATLKTCILNIWPCYESISTESSKNVLSKYNERIHETKLHIQHDICVPFSPT